MSEFHDTLVGLTGARDALAERVADDFGAAIVNDIFNPMLAEVSLMAQLSMNAERSLRDIDQVLDTARTTGDTTR